MNLITLYTQEVGRRLPEDQRADLEKEIRTLIDDTLDDESQKTGRPVDEDMTVDILRRLGPPEKLAASYLPPRYLIGPELYPYFIKTLRAVLSVATVVAALVLGISLGAEGEAAQGIGEVFARIIGGILDVIFKAAGVVVLVFAIFQFAGHRFQGEQKAWDPRSLRAAPDTERVGIAGSIGEIIANVLALVLFNLYPEWLGFSTLQNGQWVHVPFLTAAFFRYVPWLSAIWVLEILLHARLVAQGRWTRASLWAGLALNLLSVIVMALLLTGPSMIAIDPASLAALGWEITANIAPEISRALTVSARLVLGIIIALQIVEAGKQLLKIFRDRLPEPLIVGE